MKTTTCYGLNKLEHSDPADISQLNGNWDFIDQQLWVLNKLLPRICYATLKADSWTDKFYGVTLTADYDFTSDTLIEFLPDTRGEVNSSIEQIQAFQQANILGYGQSGNYITLYAMGDVPTVDIPVAFIIRGEPHDN